MRFSLSSVAGLVLAVGLLAGCEESPEAPDSNVETPPVSENLQTSSSTDGTDRNPENEEQDAPANADDSNVSSNQAKPSPDTPKPTETDQQAQPNTPPAANQTDGSNQPDPESNSNEEVPTADEVKSVEEVDSSNSN